MTPCSSPIIQWRNFRLTPLELLIILLTILGIIFLISTWTRTPDQPAAHAPTALSLDAIWEQAMNASEKANQQVEQLRAEITKLQQQLAEQKEQIDKLQGVAGRLQSLEQGRGAPPPAATVQPVRLYTVKAGDTLQSIARQNQISLQNLLAWNKLKVNEAIKVGQRLRLSPDN